MIRVPIMSVILFSIFFVASCFFSKLMFSKIISGILSVSNRLDPDQARQNVGPDLSPNCYL